MGTAIPFLHQFGRDRRGQRSGQGMTNDLLTGYHPFDVQNKRRAGDHRSSLGRLLQLGLRSDLIEISKRGNQPLGNGTYQRITDVNGDGMTDYDYFFSIRGTELAAPIDYNTTADRDAPRTIAAGIGSVACISSARTSRTTIPSSSTTIRSGSPIPRPRAGAVVACGRRAGCRRAPSNEAWNLVLNGGVAFAGRSNLTLTMASGEMNQDEPFAPITTNTSLIGTKDLNGDGCETVETTR